METRWRNVMRFAVVAALAAVGRGLESVLTNPVLGPRQGTGWLLHSGTEHDTCERPDAVSGLRVMCVAW
jgi:hypothetical protein